MADYTDPLPENVKAGVSYTFNGEAKVGTYTGADLWSDPGIANVKAGVEYKANSATNNRTGTLAGNLTPSDLQAIAEASYDYFTASGRNLDMPVRFTSPYQNICMDQPVWSPNNILLSCRIRLYSDPLSIGTDSNVVGTYLMSAIESEGKVQDYRVTQS